VRNAKRSDFGGGATPRLQPLLSGATAFFAMVLLGACSSNSGNKASPIGDAGPPPDLWNWFVIEIHFIRCSR